MDFRFTDEQQSLAAGVGDWLRGRCSAADVRRSWDEGLDRGRWAELAQLGVVGLLAPPDAGGLGMTAVDLVLALEQAGFAALPEPLGEVAAVTVPLLTDLDTPPARALLRDVTSGARLVLPALASDPIPAHLRNADAVLLQVGDDLRLVTNEELELVDQPGLDGGRPTTTFGSPADAQLKSAGTHLARDVQELLHRAGERGAWAAAAQLVGVGRAMIDMATRHALQREQFGRPIGSFQAIKHHLASALVEIEFARPLVHRAAWSLAAGDADAGIHCSMAKAVAAEAADTAARAALQVHGAIGYTWEHALHLWMKRAWSLGASFGPAERHWQAIEAATV